MAATLELLAPTGLTLTVELYPHGSDTIANTGGDNLTEATNRKGLYTATISETLSGWHTVHVKLSGTLIAASDVLMVDGETCRVRDHDPKTDVAFIDGTEQTAGDIAAILAAIKGAGWTTETLVSLQAAVAAIDPLDATETQAAAAAAIAAYDPPTKAEMDASFNALDWVNRAIIAGTVNAVTSNADFTLTSDDLGSVDNLYRYCWLVFTDGPNKGTGRMIQVYTGSTKRVQFTGAGSRGAFATTVTAGDAFYIVPTSDLVAGIIGVQVS